MFSCVPYKSWGSPYNYQKYEEIKFYDNTCISMSNDTGSEFSSITYSSSCQMKPACEICSGTIGLSNFCYFESEAIQSWMACSDHVPPINVNEYFEFAKENGLIPIITVCKGCRFNVQQKMDLINTDALDNFTDHRREISDIVQENAGGVKQRNYSAIKRHTCKEMAKLFNQAISDLKISYLYNRGLFRTTYEFIVNRFYSK